MRSTLPVHLNRDRLHTIEVKSAAFEPTGSFVIEFVNHGQAVHVHVHLDDMLSQGASLETTNLYVEADEHRRVEVDVAPGAPPLHGKLKFQTGYGATTEYVDVDVLEPDPEGRRVDVDETLSRPAAGSAEPSLLENLDDLGVAPVLALVLVAIVLAVLSVTVTDSTVVFLGVAVVLAAVAGALYTVVA